MDDSILELKEIIIKNLQENNNFKNEILRKEDEKNDQLKDISMSIIDILDSFDRIEESLIEKRLDKDEEAKKVISRYKTVQKKLLYLLQKYGISKIEFPDNKLIIGFCEVMETEVDGNRQNDEIVAIIRNGYLKGKELIRPAQVIIVKN